MIDFARPSQFRNIGKRTITALVLIGVALAALFVGRWSLWLLTSLLAMIMIWEWAGLMGVGRWRTAFAGLCMLGYLVFLYPARPIDAMNLAALGGAALIASLVAASFRLGIGIVYIGLATIALMFLREENGWQLTLWTLGIVWATDICAYFAGKTIGGPKLAPSYSPNKTWAGLIGGIAGAMLIGGALAWSYPSIPVWLAPVSGLLAIIAQCGDLYESWLKRRAGVKDSSGIFPGHGGALDRLDGLMPVVIVMAGISAVKLL